MPADIGGALVAMLPKLRRYALVVCRDAHLADDLVQAACERALATEHGPAPDAPFEAWMFTIARHLWVDRGRRVQTEGIHDDIADHEDAASTPGPEHAALARNELVQVQNALDTLPTEQREVLLLVCVEDLSYQEAADVLGIPMGTVMSRLARARLKLAQLVGRSDLPAHEDTRP